MLHRTGDPDVGQATFLFQTARFFQAHLVREQAFFHSDQEHIWKLQALGAVQRHKLDAVFVLVCLCVARFQRGMTEESRQRR